MSSTVEQRPEPGQKKRPPQLKEKAYETLKGLLIDGTFSPGDLLSERKLAARFGMSNTPVRSAIERLQGEGFLEISPQQGILVRELSAEEISEQYQIRIALESFVVRNIAGKLSEEQIASIDANLASQRSIIERGSGPELIGEKIQADSEFHMLLCHSLGNREICKVMSHLRDRVSQVMQRGFARDDARFEVSYREHLKVWDAVRNGQGDEAAAAMVAHLESGKGSLFH